MSLRDLGIFNGLPAEHPLVIGGIKCWKCDRILGGDTRVALNPTETSDETNSLTVEAKAVCATCHLRGKEIMTPAGRRIVDRIKDGNGSPYPVETTDGKQWRDDEVSDTVI